MKKSHKSLEAEGWMFQFVADETLAKDAVEIYDLLGYEVYLQPPKPAILDEARKKYRANP